MNTDFNLVRNHHEQAVFDAVRNAASNHSQVDGSLLADVACVALNRLPPRYIRHQVDFSFYLSDSERATNEQAITRAVDFAFNLVQSRSPKG